MASVKRVGPDSDCVRVPPLNNDAKDLRTRYPQRMRDSDFNTMRNDTQRQRNYTHGRQVIQKGIERGGGAVVKSGHTHGGSKEGTRRIAAK